MTGSRERLIYINVITPNLDFSTPKMNVPEIFLYSDRAKTFKTYIHIQMDLGYYY